jgi:hypothetical protein
MLVLVLHRVSNTGPISGSRRAFAQKQATIAAIVGSGISMKRPMSLTMAWQRSTGTRQSAATSSSPPEAAEPHKTHAGPDMSRKANSVLILSEIDEPNRVLADYTLCAIAISESDVPEMAHKYATHL